MFIAGRFFAGFGVGLISALSKFYLPISSTFILAISILQSYYTAISQYTNINSLSVPLYQSETAPKWIRGVIVGCYQWAITIGLLLAAVVDNATQSRQDSGSYRIPISIQFLWVNYIVHGSIELC